MLALTIRSRSNTNKLQLDIPDELKGIELQIIILPATSRNETFEYFTNDELQRLSTVKLDTDLNDNEDYTKW